MNKEEEEEEKFKMLLDVITGEVGLKLSDFEKENLIKTLNTRSENRIILP